MADRDAAIGMRAGKSPGRSATVRIGVLASGSGSNFQAVVDHFATGAAAAVAQVALLASDRAGAGALDRARTHGIASEVLDATGRTTGLLRVLERHEVDLVVLAGYLRLVPAEVIAAFRGRIVNVHPALLPAFGGPGMYGHRVHEAVLAHGARLSGVTVHFVDEEYDRGPIIAQWPVPVLPGDTPDSLAARVLPVEHLLYPRVVEALASGRVRLEPDNGVVLPTTSTACDRFSLVSDPSAIAMAIDQMLALREP
ncbi:MAG TPA: phosphoribosylglycinamide formyltransferase [Gemmatimonadaceae bacterium]